MGDTLNKVAILLTDTMFALWDKVQIIIALKKSKVGNNVTIVGALC